MSKCTKIKDLVVGMKGISLVGRVIFVGEEIAVDKRKLKCVDVTDGSGSVELTMFSEVADKFKDTFRQE